MSKIILPTRRAITVKFSRLDRFINANPSRDEGNRSISDDSHHDHNYDEDDRNRRYRHRHHQQQQQLH